MKDRDIEDLLNRYRPSDPPMHLERRILPLEGGSYVARPRTWPWAAAAAALLALTLGLHAGRAPAKPVAPTADVAALAESLGGDDFAWHAASFIVLAPAAPADERGSLTDIFGDLK